MSRPDVNVWLYGDIVCPWTYLAFARAHRVRDSLGQRVKLVWRPLPIRPETDAEKIADSSVEPTRAASFLMQDASIGPDAAEFEQTGLAYSGLPSTVSPSHALRAVEFAKDLDGELALRVLQALFEAGFDQRLPLGDRDDLLAFCERLGLDREGLKHALADGRYDAEFERAEAEASLYGIDRVPTLLVGHRKLVGAAPLELLAAELEAALADASGAAG
jgi:predicted DsbA family dithiol-disulfide isomerase